MLEKQTFIQEEIHNLLSDKCQFLLSAILHYTEFQIQHLGLHGILYYTFRPVVISPAFDRRFTLNLYHDISSFDEKKTTTLASNTISKLEFLIKTVIARFFSLVFF